MTENITRLLKVATNGMTNVTHLKVNTGVTEAKSSATAPLTPNQAKAFPEIEKTGATVKGAGKPGFPGGTQIPPTKVDIVRPNQQP
jgi:hypothetical protein